MVDEEVRWWHLAFAFGVSVFGLYYALTTKLGQRRPSHDPAGFVFNLRLYVKLCGWIFAIGGLIGTIQILFMLIDRAQ
jgi:hypothetical protein